MCRGNKSKTLSLFASKKQGKKQKGHAASMSLLIFVVGHSADQKFCTLTSPQELGKVSWGKVENTGNYNKQGKPAGSHNKTYCCTWIKPETYTKNNIRESLKNIYKF